MNDQEINSQELLEESNRDERDDIKIPKDLRAVIAYTRDWTVDTIVRQLEDKNILLDPKFQRRNAWNDQKRSALIESLIWGAPIPQIILAELPDQPRKYVVIDGKQRLLAIWGYIDPSLEYWEKPHLKDLRVLDELTGKSFKEINASNSANEIGHRLLNADVRCTILSNYKSEDVLAEIFYRINTGSVLLGAQELRQVLKRGWFADYLVEITNSPQPLHEILGLEGPDVRLNDIEIILRALSIKNFGKDYRGNLKDFLDESMSRFAKSLTKEEAAREYEWFNDGIEKLKLVFKPSDIGRKRKNGEFEKRFNRSLFEAVHFLISQLPTAVISQHTKELQDAFNFSLETNVELINSIESTTKSMERTKTRYRELAKTIKDATQFSTRHPFEV